MKAGLQLPEQIYVFLMSCGGMTKHGYKLLEPDTMCRLRFSGEGTCWPSLGTCSCVTPDSQGVTQPISPFPGGKLSSWLAFPQLKIFSYKMSLNI